MTQFAGQMLPFGHPAATGPQWVLANGRFYRHARASDYHKRHGFRPGVTGIYLMRVPARALTGASRWLVLLRDDPTQPDLPADTPTASRPPPPGAPATIAISAPTGGSYASPVSVSGVTTSGTQLQAAPIVAGVVGAFVALTTTGTTFSGAVAMTAGANMRVRVRATAATYNYVDSAAFTVTALEADPDEGVTPHRPPRNRHPRG